MNFLPRKMRTQFCYCTVVRRVFFFTNWFESYIQPMPPTATNVLQPVAAKASPKNPGSVPPLVVPPASSPPAAFIAPPNVPKYANIQDELVALAETNRMFKRYVAKGVSEIKDPRIRELIKGHSEGGQYPLLHAWCLSQETSQN